MPESSYDLLGISPDASLPEIRRAYRTLVRTWHPDRFGSDLQLQQRAQERLKEINEAYRCVQVELAARPTCSHASGTVTPRRPYPSEAVSPASPTSHPSHSPHPPESPPLLPYFTAWQNILFLLFVYGCLHFTVVRHGSLFSGAAYALQMLLLPVCFSLVCNSRLGSRRMLWGAYVAVVTVFASMVVVDAFTYKQGLQDALLYRNVPGLEGGEHIGSGRMPPADESGPYPGPQRRLHGGPVSPSSPVVPAPAAPLAPAAPVAPLAPPAR